MWDEKGSKDFEAFVQFPVPSIGVESVLSKLRKARVIENTYTIVLTPETVVSALIEALKKRYSGTPISQEELIARAKDLAPETSTYFAFLILSTIIVTCGLHLDSAVTIIGAMVIDPLKGPAISKNVGAVLDERKLASRGIMLQMGRRLLAIAVGALIGMLLKESILLPPGLDIREISQVTERTSPNFLSLFPWSWIGSRRSYQYLKECRIYPCRCTIAISLVSPAATSGLGISRGLPGAAAAAAVLINLLAGMYQLS